MLQEREIKPFSEEGGLKKHCYCNLDWTLMDKISLFQR